MSSKSKNGGSSGGGSDDYKVGPGRPPTHTKWKPGQSGNPKGRRKGSKNRKTVVRAAQRKLHPITRNGRPTKVTIDEIGVHNLEHDIKRGDRKAFLEWLAISDRYGDGTEPIASIEELMEEDKSIMAHLLARMARKSDKPEEES